MRCGAMKTISASKWAREEFGATQLGDVRRTRRLVDMAARAAQRPSGKVAVVFDEKCDREGAYDFLESPHVDAGAVAGSMFAATAERAEGEAVVFVALDTSMLTLTDTGETKGFGPIGSPNFPARGLMVMRPRSLARDDREANGAKWETTARGQAWRLLRASRRGHDRASTGRESGSMVRHRS